MLLCTDENSPRKEVKNCYAGVHILCFCSKDIKAPQPDLLCIRSQRDKFGEKSGYQMYQIDKVETERQVKAGKSKITDITSLEKGKNSIYKARINTQFQIENVKDVVYESVGLRGQTVKVKDAVTKSIQNGAFHAHSEPLLISLLAGSSNENRTFAVNMILKVRGDSEQGDASVRNRKKPTLNYDAVTLLELIDWSNEQILEPNFTCNMTKKDLQKVIDSPMEVSYYPLHTQSCGRVVKQVTEAAAAVYGFQRRDGFIRARTEH